MSIITLYLLLLKATATSFAGMGSLPQVRQDLVVTAHAISDEQLSQAVLIGRSTPGPVGAYVVAVGYFADGVAGAFAGLLAVMTPALAAVPLMALMQRWLHLPRVRAAVDAVVMASAALLVASVIQMASDGAQQLARVVGWIQ
jgi:chromate transporter